MKATIHWVSASHAVDAEIRLYESLMLTDPHQDSRRSGLDAAPQSPFPGTAAVVQSRTQSGLNRSRHQCPDLNASATFIADPDSAPTKLVFNRTVTLKDAWAKIEKSHPR